MHRSTVERRLNDTHQRLVRARSELTVLDEQLTVVTDIADDTRLKALVAETPVACREHDEASRHAAAMLRSRQDLVESITELERRRDELLDRLVVGPS
jgi:chromosome segregation ATPase